MLALTKFGNIAFRPYSIVICEVIMKSWSSVSMRLLDILLRRKYRLSDDLDDRLPYPSIERLAIM